MKIVTILVLVAMLAGCRMLAGGPGAGSGGRSDDPDTPVVSSPDPSAEPPPGDNARREEPNPDVVDEHGAAIDHFRIGPDGRTVVVHWWGGTPSCFALKEVFVEVQHGTPIVTVLEGTLPEAVGKACTMEAVLKSAVVVLDDAILVDGSGNEHEAGEPMIFDGAMEVEPRSGLDGRHQIAVAGYRLDADGTRLQVHFVGGTERCYGLAEARVERGEGRLTVTVAEGRLPGVNAPCEDIGVAKFTTLALDQPLIAQAAVDS